MVPKVGNNNKALIPLLKTYHSLLVFSFIIMYPRESTSRCGVALPQVCCFLHVDQRSPCRSKGTLHKLNSDIGILNKHLPIVGNGVYYESKAHSAGVLPIIFELGT